MRREISEIMQDFLEDFSEENNRIIIGEKAKAAVKEMVDGYRWDVEGSADYKAHILEQSKKHEIDPITVCIKDMLEKIVNAPTMLHLISVPRLIMPVLYEFMQEEWKDGKLE